MCAIVYGPVRGLKKSGPDTKKQNSRSRGPAKANNHEQDVIATMFVALGRSREEREIARAQRSSRIVRPGPLDLYASNQEQRKNERTNRTGGPLSPSSVPLVSAAVAASAFLSLFAPRVRPPFLPPFAPHPPRTTARIRASSLATSSSSTSTSSSSSSSTPASRGRDVIHACDATTWIVLLHRCRSRIMSDTVAASYIRLLRSRVRQCRTSLRSGIGGRIVGTGIVDSESRKRPNRGSTLLHRPVY